MLFIQEPEIEKNKTHKPKTESLAPGPADTIFGNYLEPAKLQKKEHPLQNKRTSKSNRRNRKEKIEQQPIQLEDYEDTVEIDSDNDALKVFKKAHEKPSGPSTHKIHNDTFAAKSETEPHLVPWGMDIESGR